jgi:hypothetical protein
MSTLQEFQSVLQQFQASFRKTDAPALEVSGIYVLYPGPGVVPPQPVTGNWPDQWPHHDRCGVYVLIDANCEIVYVGKASPGTIGTRLCTYFHTEKDGSCRIVHDQPGGWRKRPAYLMVIAVPKVTPLEAMALEKYLIRNLSSLDNTVGVARDNAI